MMPRDIYPLARRDILTLAGLASISPFALEAAQAPTRASSQPPTARRRELYALMGELPPRDRAIGGKKRREAERDGYVLETWDLDLNGIELVPAYLARPTGASGRRPAVLFNHSHGGGYKIGKQEFVDGRSYLQPVPYAKELTGLGYVAEYAGTGPQTSSHVEFKSTGGPKNLIINNPLGVTLHSSRTIDGTVTLSNGILNIPAANILTIAHDNAIAGTGFGSTKHINTKVSGANHGFLRVDKITAGSPYLFPLGNGTYYLPVTLTTSDANMSNNTFSVAAFHGITANGLPNGTAITDKSNMVDAVWTINNNIGNTTLPVDITLSWSGLEGVNFSTLADNVIGIAHYDNPAWGDFTGSGNQLNNTATRLGVTTFSPFAVGQLGAFNSALIAAPHSSAMSMVTPVPIPKGLYNKSNEDKKGMQLMNVFPNPVSNKLQLHFAVNKNDKVAVTIIAADGTTVYSKAIKLQPGKSSTTLDVSGFLKGTYFARALFEDGQITTIKFIK